MSKRPFSHAFQLTVALLVATACGTMPKPPADAGVDPSSMVADANVEVPPQMGCTALRAFQCQGATIEEKLKCISGVTTQEVADSGIAGLRRFDLTLTQPVDHFAADAGPTFAQRLILWHRSETSPTVLFTSGYGLSRSVTEPTRLLAANQLTYEHRYFGPSTPNDSTFQYLTVAQAAADAHQMIEHFRPLYRQRWLNTGGSKGGMTSTFQRRFYPCDVNATVAYVAPITEGAEDAAYGDFLQKVGGEAYATCRQDIVKAQRAALTRRSELVPLLPTALSFETLGKEKAFEFTVLDANFGFWQYTSPDSVNFGCSKIPKPDAPAQALFDFIDRSGDFTATSDQDLEDFKGYWVAAAKELGSPSSYSMPLSDLLQFPGQYNAAAYARGDYPYNANTQKDITQWVTREATQMLFIYGEFDPWSARMYQPNEANDNLRVIVPKKNHGARIADMPPADQGRVIESLERWMDVKHVPLPGIPKPAGPFLGDDADIVTFRQSRRDSLK